MCPVILTLGPGRAATTLLEASEECQFPVIAVRNVHALDGLEEHTPYVSEGPMYKIGLAGL